MLSLYTFHAPLDRCGYLPDRRWRLRYEIVGQLTAAEYQGRLDAGWRRFGFSLFRPDCPKCQACRSLRVDAGRFRPSQSQRRAEKANADVRLEVGPPLVTDEKLALYDRFHAFQTELKGWPEHDPESPANYRTTFVQNPFPVEEWCYYLGDRLIGVGYVDPVPAGLSAVYFFYDPAERHRSPGTFNVLSVIRAAAARGLPWAYLGYFVEGCRSLEYKGRFRPNQVVGPDGAWRDFRM